MMVDICGARLAMALGGMMNVCTLSMYWMIATERWKIHDLELLLVVLSSLGVLTFVGCALVTGSVFKVIVESCGSGTKGQAVGCAKGYVGVGSGVYVCLFGALFGGSGGGGGGGGGAVAVTRPASLGVGMEEHNYMGNSLNWAWMLPSSSWISLAASSTTTTATTTDDATIPESPELNSLNFLLMASVLSFSAAVLPALIFLPKQTSSSSCRDRRDGTRPLHFRVIYAGLIALGAWVVGMSLFELKEENDEKNSRSSGESNVAPSLVDSLEEDFSWENNNEFYFENDYSYHPTSISRKLWMAATRQLASASSPERHWGTAFFIILLWWGPALSLLFIPPRKECSDESDMIDNEELFMYDDEVDDGETDVGLSRSVLSRGHAGKEDEEETFLQEELPNRRALEVKDMNVGNDRTRPALGSDFTMLQMLRTAPAWLMAYPCVIIVS